MNGDTPPRELDGATVLAFAHLDGATETGGTRHFANGKQLTGFSHLAIARYDDGDGFYLFYCGPDWTVLTDTWHESRAAAEEQAAFEFMPVTFVDA